MYEASEVGFGLRVPISSLAIFHQLREGSEKRLETSRGRDIVGSWELRRCAQGLHLMQAFEAWRCG